MLESGMQMLTLGDPLDESTEVGPIGNARQYRRVSDMISQAEEDDGGRVIGCTTPEGDGFFVSPTILTVLSPDAAAAVSQEFFGPVVTSLAFSDNADAITIAKAPTSAWRMLSRPRMSVVPVSQLRCALVPSGSSATKPLTYLPHLEAPAQRVLTAHLTPWSAFSCRAGL